MHQLIVIQGHSYSIRHLSSGIRPGDEAISSAIHHMSSIFFTVRGGEIRGGSGGDSASSSLFSARVGISESKRPPAFREEERII